jgi:CheY-like chemotaxis protein
MARVLIIEDELDIRANLGRFLKLEGHDVSEAADGIEGVEKALAYPPQLILCDVSMPRLDGYGVLERLRGNSRTRDIPFVFISASVEPGKQARGVEMGARAYVTKPFNLAAMRELVRTLLAPA